MSKRVLITGMAGFVGSHVMEYLLETTDWEIVGIVRMSRAGNLNRIQEILDKNKDYEKRVRIVRHDLLDPLDSISRHLGNFNYIVHMAADSHVDDSIRRRKEVFLNNTISTVNMLEYAINFQDNLSKMIYYSTDEVYGDAEEGYKFIEEDVLNPRNPYSAGKASGEMAVNAWAQVTKIPVLTMRTMNMFGERQDPEKMIPYTIRRYMNKLPATIHTFNNTPGQRHWLYAKNSADAIKFCLENKINYKRINVPGQIELDNYEIAKKISEIMGIDFKYELIEASKVRPGYDRRYSVNGDRLLNLGWKYPYTFEEMLEKTVKFSMENSEWVK